MEDNFQVIFFKQSCPRRTPLAVGDEYMGMADDAAVNGKWDRNGCAGM